jgi:hypothetical protein
MKQDPICLAELEITLTSFHITRLLLFVFLFHRISRCSSFMAQEKEEFMDKR